MTQNFLWSKQPVDTDKAGVYLKAYLLTDTYYYAFLKIFTILAGILLK